MKLLEKKFCSCACGRLVLVFSGDKVCRKCRKNNRRLKNLGRDKK